jgi:hypothetical protein
MSTQIKTHKIEVCAVYERITNTPWQILLTFQNNEAILRQVSNNSTGGVRDEPKRASLDLSTTNREELSPNLIQS